MPQANRSAPIAQRQDGRAHRIEARRQRYGFPLDIATNRSTLGADDGDPEVEPEVVPARVAARRRSALIG